jgi:hypothetical protein
MRAWCIAIGLGLVAPAQGDVDDASYDASSQRLSVEKRRTLEADFEQEQKREEERERKAREAAAREASERQAALAARPYSVRLLEKRCTACHDDTNYRQQAHTAPGWFLVVLRMKYLNGASIEHDELSIIANQLATEHPANGLVALLEYATLPTALGLMAGVASFVWRRRRGKD